MVKLTVVVAVAVCTSVVLLLKQEVAEEDPEFRFEMLVVPPVVENDCI
jgi:hypothetical protein